MKNFFYHLLGFLFLILSFTDANAFKKQEYFEIRTYYFENKTQEDLLDKYLKNALIPALQKQKITKVGVFKPISNDTGIIKRIVVFIAFKKMDQFLKIEEKLEKNPEYLVNGKDFINSHYANPAYKRIEKVFLKAFSKMPISEKPNIKSSASTKVYELRSYESTSEKFYKNKVHMFNEGGEIDLFRQLGFNAIFYGEVLIGNRMPNLMYMTSFESMDERNSHWKNFGSNPVWKNLSSMPEYKNNVSRSEIILMRSTEYSNF